MGARVGRKEDKGAASSLHQHCSSSSLTPLPHQPCTVGGDRCSTPTHTVHRPTSSSKQEGERRKEGKKVKANTSKTTPHRVALADLTNQLPSPVAEPPSAVSSSASSSSSATLPDVTLTIPLTFQVPIQSPPPPPPPSTSSSSPPPPIPFTSPHAAGLLSAGARISGKQQKKEIKRKVAEETHLLVQSEMQRRQRQDEVIEVTGQTMRDISRLTTKLECWLDRQLAGRECGASEFMYLC